MNARSTFTTILTFAAGFLVAAFVSAAFEYFGMPLGPTIIRLIDPSSGVGVQEKNYLQDVLPSRFASPLPVPSQPPPFPDFAFDDGHCAGIGWRQKQIGYIHKMYSDEHTARGLSGGGMRDNAKCFEARLSSPAKPLDASQSDAFVIVWRAGPSCRFGRCAIDVVLCCDNNARKVLSVRASRVGLGLGRTRGMRDIVVDDRYVFAWTGENYEARPAR